MSGVNHFLEHLIELRRRLLHSMIAVFALFFILFYFSKSLFYYLARPLLISLPQGDHLIATSVAAPLIIPLKFSFILAIVVAMPFLLYQLWAFIAPGLYHKERHFLWLLLFPSIVLFYMGVCFAYWIVFPLVFSFFSSMTPPGISLLPDMSQYLEFTLKLFLSFGLVFEVPIITMGLVLTGIVTIDGLREKRPYVIVFSFVIGMVLTPPDVLSQILVAIPMCLLFELGLLLARFTSR